MAEDFTAALERLLQARFSGFESLLDCQKLTAGASQETHRVAVQIDGAEQRFALRRAVPTLDVATGVGGISLDTEAQLLVCAAQADVCVPVVICVLRPEDQLGSGFLMQWLEGETLGHKIVGSEQLAEARSGLALRCGQELGRIHSIDWQAQGLHNSLSTVAPLSLVDETYQVYKDLELPAPMIDYCWRWLRDHVPENTQMRLVHGDFRNGNLMIAKTGLTAVLDWELAHIGDPLRDLGWLCVNSWRFGERGHVVGGFGDVQDLLDGYNEVTGASVEASDIHYWQVFGSFWWAITTLAMAQTWRTGETPSLERPVIGRRSSEAQMDCVHLLIPGDYDLPEPAYSLAEGDQLPMPAELVHSVAEFLKRDVADQLQGADRFLARVAANSLGIAQREILYAPALAKLEQQRLSQFLGETHTLQVQRWRLVEQLRDGLALNAAGLAEHLRNTVAGQLWIDQPGYSALKPD